MDSRKLWQVVVVGGTLLAACGPELPEPGTGGAQQAKADGGTPDGGTQGTDPGGGVDGW